MQFIFFIQHTYMYDCIETYIIMHEILNQSIDYNFKIKLAIIFHFQMVVKANLFFNIRLMKQMNVVAYKNN